MCSPREYDGEQQRERRQELRFRNFSAWRGEANEYDDWLELYAYRPVLLETFVDSERHEGTCYRAANWHFVGLTKGRGKLDRRFEANKSKKSVLLYPLVKDAPNLLRT